MKINGLILELNHENQTASISGSLKLQKDIYVDRSYQGYVIVSIDKLAFKMDRNINSIKFADNSELKLISKRAFYGSTLSSISIPSNLKILQKGWCIEIPKLIHISISPKNNYFSYLDEKVIIGKSTNDESKEFDKIIFARRDINNTLIPSFIKYIGQNSFSDCSKLNKITFSNDSKLLSIEKSAFSFSFLQDFSIPESVENLEDGWCKDTTYLTNVYLSPKNKNFKYLDDDHKIILSKSDKNNEIFDEIAFACRNITEFSVPSFITRIRSDSFSRCKSLEILEIKEDSMLKSIGKRALFQTSIENIFIPKYVYEIKKEAFMDINDQFNIEFDDDSNLLTIEDYAFCGSSIEEITIPSNVQKIGHHVFIYCDKLQKVTFQNDSNLLSIGQSSFSMTLITNIVIPKNVKKIECKAFYECNKLKEVDFSQNTELTEIEENLFAYSSVEKIILSKNIVKINDNAFFKCMYLDEVFIPKDSELRSIGINSFSGTQINTLYIPQYLNELKESWCYYTPGISNISISPMNKNFAFYDKDHKIVVGKSILNSDRFDSLVLVSREMTSIKIPSFIKYLCTCSLSSCEELKRIEFDVNSKLISIDAYAFSSSFFERITIPCRTNYIGKGAFNQCFAIKTISFLGDNVTIDKNCFNFCSNLFLIEFPNSVQITLKGDEFIDVSEHLSIFVLANTILIECCNDDNDLKM